MFGNAVGSSVEFHEVFRYVDNDHSFGVLHDHLDRFDENGSEDDSYDYGSNGHMGFFLSGKRNCLIDGSLTGLNDK